MATKKDLIYRLVKQIDHLSEVDATLAVDIVIEYIKNQLIQGHRIELRQFGTFSLRKRKFSGTDSVYNTIYYRMSKNVRIKLQSINT